MEIIITLIVIFVLIIVIQIFIRVSSQKDKKKLVDDWMSFQKAKEQSDINSINYYGDKLIWNKHLKQDQLTEVISQVDYHISTNPELEKLKLDAFNKQLHYDRALPYSGSSGGKKQSW